MATSQQQPRSRRPGPVLITEAATSLSEQHAARKKRYLITMIIRAVAILLAAIFYQTVWLMIGFAVLGTVLPWIAVVMANDRPPKKRAALARPSPGSDPMLEAPRPTPRVIDG